MAARVSTPATRTSATPCPKFQLSLSHPNEQENGAWRSALSSHAPTGIGRATVVELVSAGYRVFATVRREADAESLRQQLPELVTPVIMDLLDEDSVRAAGEMINSAGPLFGLVNNAGAALPGPLETIPIEVFRRQIEINLTAQLLVTQVMLPALHVCRADRRCTDHHDRSIRDSPFRWAATVPPSMGWSASARRCAPNLRRSTSRFC
jgi:NAD(P)-dependent dehydrogenase (short-subunit alcohol dehydrogenase family)